ncbi:sigma-54-dependent transcriptional regulator [Hymenobacter arizonensis]|uniref:DNA-binding transcriptional response regulator, NtrC family, contains REC, AAA-type ATPase, and a Fis-type DNA-binding domains n=1 Tax=Hymenobacter arizonensis TaxID=1227077 RepID=A0A1I5UR85_HYMAR|nr:sigma-54 dependent transcriptional regulator [Hymenobacter arizonensis]SFP97814.1 DNA-binding transcriptional response regulator, NtrC family, contains REC, AAA-type ATPase, and a Fis-type DNA-binding domains [Hymenobacter arizonensis]
MPRILIIDDERAIRHTLKEILEFENYTVDQAEDGPAGLDMLIQQKYDVVLCDIKMPKMDGLEVLTRAQAMGTDAAFIMVSAHGSIDTAVEATKKGAYDFLSKPPDLNRLLVTVRNALDRTKLVTETKTLKKKLSVAKGSEMVGASSALGAVRKAIEKVAPTDARVLITGPNGAGKEMVARQLHELSQRAQGPMVEVNCAAIPSELIESELFGHEKGSFTSAVKQRIGKFEQADGGTLFLDEIGDMSLSAQAKVLRALQESKITRVGGEKEISVNVRVLAATNKDLMQEIADKNFREDLYHRLSVILIQVPPLNDRREDIPDLIQKFLNDIAADYGNKPKKIDAVALQYLKGLDWRGNIRELRNVVERLVIMSDDTISEGDAKAFAGK